MNSLNEIIVELLTGLGLTSELSSIILIGLSIVIWIIIGIITSKVLEKLIFRMFRNKNHSGKADTIARLMSNISKYIIWFIILLIILGELNIDVTPFIASASVIGFAIGFGAQEIVKDFLSGFFIIFDNMFNVGDLIQSDGFTGTVESIGLRSTKIVNWQGQTKIIRNGNLGSIINFSTNDSIAIVDFGVAYETDLHKMYELMPSLLNQIKDKYAEVVEEPKFLGITELADSSINMRIVAKTEMLKHFQTERSMRKDVVEFCIENEIEIPYPKVVVHND